MDLKTYLRQTVAIYGFHAVHKSFQEICKEDYDFLKTLYYAPEKSEKPHKVKAPEPQAAQAPQEESEEIPRPEKLRGDSRVRIVKKPAEDLPQAQPTQPTQPTIIPLTHSPTQPTHTESGLTDPKDIKKWQKEQEEKKKRELDAQGINPASLLTKENLQKWIVEEKKTFAAVARDYVGLPDSMVSSAAKSYGIQSETSKRRAIIAASKRT